MPYTVYALFDEREPDAVRYVGFSVDPEKRFYSHLGEAQRSQQRSHRLNWIRKVSADGPFVHWRTLLVVETADAAALAEIASIKAHLDAGHQLTNGTEGGEGVQGFGGVLSPEALARRTAAMATPAYLARRSEQSTEYWASEGKREYQRLAMEAFWQSPEGQAQRARNSATNTRIQTGQKRSPEAREKMRLAKLGKPGTPRTDEWKAKIAAAQKGKPRRPWTDKERVRHMAGMNREKMSASAKARKR
jgi:hypothetical protein